MNPISSKQAEKGMLTEKQFNKIAKIAFEATQKESNYDAFRNEYGSFVYCCGGDFCDGHADDMEDLADTISQTLLSYRQELIGKLEGKKKKEGLCFCNDSDCKGECDKSFNQGLQIAIDLLGGK